MAVELTNADLFGAVTKSATKEEPVVDGAVDDAAVSEDMLLALSDFESASKPEDRLEAFRFLMELAR